MSLQTLEQAGRARDELVGVVAELEHLAHAFGVVGNQDMCDKLYFLAERITNAADDSYDAHSGMIDEAFNATQQASTNLFKTALEMTLREEEGD